jgi:hypothetical protein
MPSAQAFAAPFWRSAHETSGPDRFNDEHASASNAATTE